MEEPLRARTVNEVRYYLMVRPCPACGKGPLAAEAEQPAAGPGQPMRVDARCRHCGQAKTFSFVCEFPLPDSGPEAESINPADTPSSLIDLGQWLSLFYLLMESAAAEPSTPLAGRASFRAGLCLAEALKFYGEDELPPASAFFTDATAASFRQHPENFARQKLRDMQARLPALHVLARRLARDERSGARRWWKPWRR